MKNKNLKIILFVLLIGLSILPLISTIICICLCIREIVFIINSDKYERKLQLESDLNSYHQNKLRQIDEEVTLYKSNKIKETNQEIENYKNREFEEINNEFENLKNNKIKEIENLKTTIEELENNELSTFIDSFVLDSYDDNTSDECKQKLSLLRLKIKDFLKEDNCIINIFEENYNQKRIDANNKKQLIRCFDSECNNILSSVTVKNYDNCIEKISRAYQNLNTIFKTDNIKLSEELLSFKLQELNLLKDIQLKQEQEKEVQKAIKEQLVEEEKVRKEIEREKSKIEKEEKQFNNELSKMLAYLQKANNDVEREIYANKIKELEEKIKLLEKDKENVLQRETNTRAGFVYVISNIGSFGENIFKIGMTRRLEPMDRISELSSASVPFPFDVHAIMFSEDAPALENSIHKYFQDKSVNKVNLRKEFFKIDVKELKNYILNELNQNVNFVEIPEAQQYRESLNIN